jgi:hypothetical protein
MSFLLAAVAKPMLGHDFLPKFRVLVDLFSKRVLEAVLLRLLSSPYIFVRRSTFTAAIRKILIHCQ